MDIVYYEYSEDAIKHFNFESTPKVGVLFGNSLYEAYNDYDKYHNIEKVLSNFTITDLSLYKNKKAFLYPLCPISLIRVKNILNKFKIKLTYDIHNADFYIGHDSITRKVETYAIPKKALLTYFNSSYSYDPDNLPPSHSQYKNVLINNNLEKLYIAHYKPSWGYRNYNAAKVISAAALDIAYNIDYNKKEVISIDDVLKQDNMTVLTFDVANDIIRMFNSGNDDDISMALKILPGLDYTQNRHVLHHLSINLPSYKIPYDKDVTVWLSNSKFNEYEYRSAEQLINDLIKNNITKEEFIYFEKLARQEINITNRNMYIFNVKLKPEYQKYLE